jgi:RNA polymerase sigma-70 factor (ECF subfamily)
MLFNQSDQQLIEKALAGSQRAWVKLVRRHETRVYNYCLRMSGCPADAMDLMQEVFLAVYRNLPNFRGDSQLTTWLFRIASNKTTDWLRRHHRTPTRSAEPLEQLDYELEKTGFAHSDQHEQLNQQLTNQRIMNHLAQLPEEQRLVIELKFFQHFTFDEIAEQLNLAPSTVKTRVYSALKKLKGQLEVKHVV